MTDNVVWVDVQGLLERACQEMKLGELVHPENFKLLEAMSAVEVGNTRMDAGMTDTKTVQQLINEGCAPTTLTPAQMLAVTDRLAVMEATWHTGGPLAQTVYSSLYMLRPDRMKEDHTMDAICRLVRATVQQVRLIVLQGVSCEEEDIHIMAFGLALEEEPSKASDDTVLAAANAAIAELAALQQSQQDAGAADAPILEALLHQLRFRKALLQGLQLAACKGREDLQAAASLFQAARAQVTLVRSTDAIVAAEPPVGFSETINRHLLAPAPPRACKIMERPAAWDHLALMLDHLIEACNVVNHTELDALQQFIITFAEKSPGAVARSALHMQLSWKTWENVPEGPPAWAPSQPMLQRSCHLPERIDDLKDLANFVEQAHIAVGNWVQAMLMNRGRCRRRLRRGLEDWANLWQHAWNAENADGVAKLMVEHGWDWKPMGQDGFDQQGPLGTWVEVQTCRCMLQHLLMGFDLELYTPREYALVFWYCDYLYMVLLAGQKQLATCRPKPGARPAAGPKLPRKGKKGREREPPGPSPAQLAAQRLAMVEHMRDMLLLELQKCMAAACIYMMQGLQTLGYLTGLDTPYNSEVERFDQRFACFHELVRPDPLTYDQARIALGNAANTPWPDLLKHTGNLMQQARNTVQLLLNQQYWELTPSQAAMVRAADKAALQNSIALQVLQRAQDAGSKLVASFDHSLLPCMPVLVLKGSKR